MSATASLTRMPVLFRSSAAANHTMYEQRQIVQKVLIIDDSPLIHTLLSVRLKDEPVLLQSAFDGKSGLALALSFAPDLILLDVDMPGLDGFEVCRRLKGSKLTVEIPIIFLSGASQTEEKIKGLDLGAIDYITKPFDVAELKARVRAGL